MAPSTWLTNQCTDLSTWLTHQPEKDVSCKVLQFIQMMKIKKLLVHKTLRCTNATASSRERWTRTYVSGHNILAKNLCILLHHLWRPLKQSLYMFKVVRKESSNIYTWIEVKSKNSLLSQQVVTSKGITVLYTNL